MKVLGYLLLISLVLAAIKAALAALLVAAVVAGIGSLVQRPRETLLTMSAIGATFAFVAHPLIVAGILLAAAIVNRQREKGAR